MAEAFPAQAVDLYTRWTALRDDAGKVSSTDFAARSRMIADMYKRMGFFEQGEFHHLVHTQA